MREASVLVVDDEPCVRRSLVRTLAAEGWSVHDCAGVVDAARGPVLIRGEAGSGKDVVALELHRRSPQAGQPLWRLHASALDERALAAALEP